MTISSVSSTPPTFQPNQQQSAVRQNFQQLTQAIQSGDLSDAQAAFATLTQNMPSQSSNGSSNNPFQQAIASIGSALQSGDLSGAQSALQNMQTQMKGMHHHHHHQGGATQQTSDDSTSDSITPSALPPTSSMSLYA